MEHSVRHLAIQIFLCSTICTLALSSGFAQSPTPSSDTDLRQVDGGNRTAVKPHGNSVSLPDETLGPDDLIEVSVSYCPELSQNFRIAPDGILHLPLLHKPLPVAGLNAIEVAQAIQHELTEQQVLVDPVVNVSVLEYRSRPVSVVGAVNHPLTFQVIGRTTLLDAIAKAGGLSATAGANIVVKSRTRIVSGGADQSAQVVPVSTLMDASSPALNLELQGGEEIRVPEASKIFVAGDVRRPGMYAMQTDAGTTVIKALALSEGLGLYAANTAYIYRLGKPGTERTELQVPLSRIMARKDQDVKLMADDILYIPENGRKRMTSSVLNRMAGFSENTATGLLVYH
jgi:polysaccharide export outer membrane protein